MKIASKSLAVLAWLGFSIPGTVCFSADLSTDGLNDYNAGRYRQAVVKLAKACGAHPQNALIHYYLANALVKIAEHDSAAEEYRIAYILDPTGMVSQYCRDALRGYKKPLPCADEVRAFRDTVGGALAIGQSNGGSPSSPHAVADPKISKALSKIQREVNLEKTNVQNFGDYHARDIAKMRERQSRQVEISMRDQIDNLRSDPFIRRAYMNNPAAAEQYIKENEARIQTAAKDEIEYIKRETTARAERYKRVAEKRQNVLDEVAENLARQMSEKPKQGGVRLVASGTDLYVRHYAPAYGNYQNPDAHAAVARIYGVAPAAEPAEPVRSVRAKVLN